jgi:hypothetical protein
MDFDKLTTDLDAQDRTIKLCAEAIRKRADYLFRTNYTDDTVAQVRHVALWLESEQGRGLVLDLSIKDDLAAAPIEKAQPVVSDWKPLVERMLDKADAAAEALDAAAPSSGATEAAQQEEAFRNMLAMDPHAQELLLGGVYRKVDAAAVAHTNAAVRAVAEKIVSIGGTQSKLGKVYMRELAALLANDSETPNGSAAPKGGSAP